MRAARVVSAVVFVAVCGCRSAEPAARPVFAAQDPVQSGINLYNEKKYSEAAQTLSSATSAEGLAYLAASLVKLGKNAEAEAPASSAVQKQATHALAVASLGESLVNQGKYDAAVARMSEAIEKDGKLAYAYFWRATAYYKKKQPDRMVADFEMFLKLAPDAPEATTVKQLLASFQ